MKPLSGELSIDHVDFRWPGTGEALFRDLTLVLPAGSTTCLIGPNGAGKTTLMEIIIGWRRAESGSVMLDGREIGAMPGRMRSRAIAIVPQEEHLPFSYSVLDYVLLGRAPHLSPLSSPGSEDVRQATDALDRVGLGSVAARGILQLSGGERRLVLIAKALAQATPVLLLDEPTNHLDPANREQVLGILAALKARGVTLMISSHDPDLAIRLADRMVLLRQGSVPLTGSARDMIREDILSSLYGIRVRITQVEGRQVIIWGT